jgi:acyl-CoA thioester hydrolase
VTNTYTCQVEVRWADLDLLGHVNNTKYFEYAMEARVHFYREAIAPDRRAGAVVLRKADMEYLRPVTPETQSLKIEVWAIHIGTTSYTLRHTMYDNSGEVCARGDAVMVSFDRKTQKPRPIRDEERAALAEYLH